MKKNHVMKHPKGFWVVSITTALFFFSFISLASLLELYLMQVLHFSNELANDTTIGFYSLIFILPLAGGYIGEKIGYQLSILMGLTLATIGVFLMDLAVVEWVYFAIALFLVGNAFFIPAVWSLIGLLYEDNHPSRDSGYTLYYLVFNVGALIGIIISGFVSSNSGFHKVFHLMTGVILITALFFALTMKRIVLAKGNSIASQLSWSLPQRISAGLISGGVILVVAFFLMRHIQYNNYFLIILGAAATLGLLGTAYRQKGQNKRNQVILFLVLSLLLVAFYLGYYLENSTLVVFALQNVDRQLGGITIPASVYWSLDGVFVILVGFFFSWLWAWLGARKQDIKAFTKVSIGVVFMGLGFFIFAFGMHEALPGYLMSSIWMILGYVCLSTAELLSVPVCMSMVGVLMPKGREGLGMGVLQVFIGAAGIGGTYIANLATIQSNTSAMESFPIFYSAFIKIGIGMVIAGLVAFFILRPLVARFLKYES